MDLTILFALAVACLTCYLLGYCRGMDISDRFRARRQPELPKPKD
jgi:hypothetical protein